MKRQLMAAPALAALGFSLLLVISGCSTSPGTAAGAGGAGGAGGSPVTSMPTSVPAATASPKVLVAMPLTAGQGGTVAASGVKLVVPAGAMQANGTGAITDEGNGMFDISLSVAWSGKLQVTVPLANDSDIVMHQVAGMWIPEGTAPGQSTVTVTHLSLFAPLSRLGSKIANGLCLKQNPLDFLNCLAGKGIGYVDRQIVQALLGKAVNACEATLLAKADSGTVTGVLIGTLIKIFSGPCVGQAGEGDWAPSASSSPSLPSNGGPIQGGNVPVQGGSPPLQGGPTSTQSANDKAPVPAGSGRILIDPCLNLRSGPNGDTTLIGCVPKDTVISIDCTAQGDSVTGPYGVTTLWDHTTYGGVSGYVSDAYVYTGQSGPVAGTC